MASGMASGPSITFEVVLDLLAQKVAERLAAMDTKPAANTERKLLSVSEAADRMGCSTKSVRHMISSGSLPQRALRRFGRRVLVDREEFDRWLAAH